MTALTIRALMTIFSTYIPSNSDESLTTNAEMVPCESRGSCKVVIATTIIQININALKGDALVLACLTCLGNMYTIFSYVLTQFCGISHGLSLKAIAIQSMT